MPRSSRRTRPAPLVYDQRAQLVTFFSPALGIDKHCYVYVPPDLAVGQRAPVLYLLRGHEREWINRDEDTSRGGTNVIDVYERLRSAGQIRPMILVFPSLASEDNAIPGMLMNMRAPELANGAEGIGSGRFEDYFFDDLLPYVDTHFPTLPGGRQRGIMGFSLGGAMAIKAAAQRPAFFAAAAAYDGTFLYSVAQGQRVRASDRVIHNPIFDAAYGIPRDTRFIAAHSASNLIARGDPAALKQVTWIIGYGPRSAEPWQANYYRGEHLVRRLRQIGLENALPQGAIPNGDHTWRTADRFMELTLPLHDCALNADQRGTENQK